MNDLLKIGSWVEGACQEGMYDEDGGDYEEARRRQPCLRLSQHTVGQKTVPMFACFGEKDLWDNNKQSHDRESFRSDSVT